MPRDTYHWALGLGPEYQHHGHHTTQWLSDTLPAHNTCPNSALPHRPPKPTCWGLSLLLSPSTCTPTSALHSARVQLGWAQAQRGRLRHLTSKPCQREPGLQRRSKINQRTIRPENAHWEEAAQSSRGVRGEGSWVCSAALSAGALPAAPGHAGHLSVRQPEGEPGPNPSHSHSSPA